MEASRELRTSTTQPLATGLAMIAALALGGVGGYAIASFTSQRQATAVSQGQPGSQLAVTTQAGVVPGHAAAERSERTAPASDVVDHAASERADSAALAALSGDVLIRHAADERAGRAR
jgi:hypothetical protein